MTTFALLETAAVVLTLLAALEMRRQQRSWQFVVVTSVALLGALTVMIAIWRGL